MGNTKNEPRQNLLLVAVVVLTALLTLATGATTLPLRDSARPAHVHPALEFFTSWSVPAGQDMHPYAFTTNGAVADPAS